LRRVSEIPLVGVPDQALQLAFVDDSCGWTEGRYVKRYVTTLRRRVGRGKAMR